MTTTTARDATATTVVIVGGGPAGYEAALVAAQLGAQVTVVEANGIGGNAVLTDVVPSKTLIATAEQMQAVADSPQLGLRFPGGGTPVAKASGAVTVDLAEVNARVTRLAQNQSSDIKTRLEREGVKVIAGQARLLGNDRVAVRAPGSRAPEELAADVILLATGARPRELPTAQPDGERILTWTQLYSLTELPGHLIVVGSGVTGAEFASAYNALGAKVTLVSSREQVLPGFDPQAADVLEDVFSRRGVNVMARTRAERVERQGDAVRVTVSGGQVIDGSHCLMAVGSVPATGDVGLDAAGVGLDGGGYITVDRVSRTTARGVYAAGDCTGVLPLASVAAMQGRIAMWHALGDAVAPLRLQVVASNVFTDPEIATVGVTTAQVETGQVQADVALLPLRGNARAKMVGIRDGFVKLFCAPNSGRVLGGVVVSPRASELIFPITLAVDARLNVDQVALAFTVYPSLSGSIAEAARRLHREPGR